MNTYPSGSNAGVLVHIGLSLFSYATLIIAALYALQLAWIDYQLKNRSWRLTRKCSIDEYRSVKCSISRRLGRVLLTLTLCTGLSTCTNLFSMEISTRPCSSIVAWFVYIVLLWGHYHEVMWWTPRRLV
ncbi:cytochrome c biogenesis protein CcsA [Escherichia coli]|uniref:cytochrome c biogenesis protein CcsA n=1 Tax=Escherichia coli TaxID=562 RepID=UPI000E0EC60A|nr:cytochrome c biogenesis protein CcsA [Escherichia coli]